MSIISLPLPSTLTNGNTADAGQVTTDLLAIASSVNANAAASGINSDITQLTALIAITSAVTFAGGLTLPNATLTTPTIISATVSGLVATGAINMAGATSVTVPTVATGDNSNNACSTAFATSLAFSAALPAISASTKGRFATNNGVIGSWGVVPTSFSAVATNGGF